VGRQVIHDDDVTGSAHACDEGHGLAVPERGGSQETSADRAPAMQPRHLGVHPAFTQEYQARGINFATVPA
jgi:hypothetical protein